MNRVFQQLSAVLQRTAVPFCVFAVALAALLGLSWSLVLPRMARVALNGELLDANRAEAEVDGLRRDILRLRESIDAFIAPPRDPLYVSLRDAVAARPAPFLLDSVLTDALTHMSSDREAVTIVRRSINADGQAIIAGDISGVGPRSMTVLAAFVDALRSTPMVMHLDPSPFTREDDAKRGALSPFVIRFTLTPDDAAHQS